MQTSPRLSSFAVGSRYPLPLTKITDSLKAIGYFWQGQKDSNPRPLVLETSTLPTELYPCILMPFLNDLNIISQQNKKFNSFSKNILNFFISAHFTETSHPILKIKQQKSSTNRSLSMSYICTFPAGSDIFYIHFFPAAERNEPKKRRLRRRESYDWKSSIAAFPIIATSSPPLKISHSCPPMADFFVYHKTK